MPFPSKLSPEQWAQARRLHADGVSAADIAARFNLRSSTISARAAREGWPRPSTGAADAGRAPVRSSLAAATSTAAIRSRLALRLYKVLECKIKIMELRMTQQLQAHERALEVDPNAADLPAPSTDERNSFAALIESINKVTEMVSEPAPAAAPAGRRKSAIGSINPELAALSDDIEPGALAAASEKDQHRRELAEHLGKMFPKP